MKWNNISDREINFKFITILFTVQRIAPHWLAATPKLTRATIFKQKVPFPFMMTHVVFSYLITALLLLKNV